MKWMFVYIIVLMNFSFVFSQSNDLKLTKNTYTQDVDLYNEVKKEYGKHYRPADWEDLINYEDNIADILKNAGFSDEVDCAIIRCQAQQKEEEQLFLIRVCYHDPAVTYMVIEQLDADYAVLSNFEPGKYPVLCVKGACKKRK